VVVDFGTAVTFDIVDSRPAYIGGVIAPGLDAMRHYLHQKTALLPKIDLERPETAVGRSTIHAMQSGAFHGYRGLTREILARVIEEMDCPAKVIATGGYAALIADGLPEIQSVEPSLTMQGLLRIARLNFSS
jgi:type III pantothenate kinase